MRKVILTTILLCSVFCTVNAQKIGHFSYKAVMEAMPAYATAQRTLQSMRQRYSDELALSEKEFSEKYELFIEQQSSLDPSISEKRQAELRSLYDSNIKFRDDSRRTLSQTEADLMTPIKARIAEVIKTVGQQGGYTLLINTDSDSCPYLDESTTDDVTPLLLQQLR